MKKIILSSLFLLLLSGCNLVQIVPPEKNQGIDESALINNANLNNELNINQSINGTAEAKLTCQGQSITETTKAYTISANYPECDLADAQKKKTLNEKIKGTITAVINSFKDDLNSPDFSQLPNLTSTFNSDYTISYADPNLISLSFIIETYYSGAAHPNQDVAVVNYDLQKMAIISLADIFKPDTKYLDKLSVICQTTFNAKFKNDVWFSEGCTPEDNFSEFVITNTGLKFLFPPYQVAPYSAGMQEIDVNYSDLNDFINKNSVLAEIIK